jgi:hypothetical protein
MMRQIRNSTTTSTALGVTSLGFSLGTKNCEQCDNQAENTTKKQDKISMRKQLTLLMQPIGIYLKEFYLSGIEKLAYQLSKNHCGTMRPLILKSLYGV